MSLLLVFITLLGAPCLGLASISFRLVNNCSSQVIWPAISTSHISDPAPDPLPNGLSLSPGQSFQTKPLVLPWGGRIWARQFCTGPGTDCLIGDCSFSSCWRSSSRNTSLFEIFADKEIWYDISLVDAFTAGISVVSDNPACRPLKCQVPPYLGLDAGGKPLCPESHMLHHNSTATTTASSGMPSYQDVYACLSDCTLYGGEKFCCGSGPGGMELCKGASPWLKAACPDAYSFASDDATSLQMCTCASVFTITYSC